LQDKFVKGHRDADLEYRICANDGSEKEAKGRLKRIAFFGHFDSTNFGNESTLRAILWNIRRYQPEAELVCISTGPQAAVVSHQIEAIPIAETFASCNSRSPLIRAARKVCVGVPRELYRWGKALLMLRRMDALIIPGTGLLTDAYGLLSWGPYSLFKWSLLAKLCRCRLLFVSVGAGPIHGILGRYFIKSVLSWADFRSYRDKASLQYLRNIGLNVEGDSVYPDLVFSFPEHLIPRQQSESRRLVVGIGLMDNAGRYGVSTPNKAAYSDYLENLVAFGEWLLTHGYAVRLLIGDIVDVPVARKFIRLLREREPYNSDQIIAESISSVEDMFSQIAATDIVVATRFHNVLIAALCNKPVLSLSFHHKCESLMTALGLSEYCLDMNNFKVEILIEKFNDLETNSDKFRPLIKEKTRLFRKALDDQYKSIFADTDAAKQSVCEDPL
jgi:polysaccharide pyruvyl transferase WcaK-like protein